MKCKQAEQWIIELSQTKLDPEITIELDNHVLNCARCSNFKKNFYRIHHAIPDIATPAPTTELLEKTIASCHDEWIEQREIYLLKENRPDAVRTPAWVWAVFLALFIVTLAWAVPVIAEAIKSRAITQQSIIVIILLIQNLMMLFFSPVLLRTLNLKLYDINFQV
ncbi:MAG: hypothetical protein MUC94_07885 [bacterium]|nr:hypothetical protein [bacterium]